MINPQELKESLQRDATIAEAIWCWGVALSISKDSPSRRKADDDLLEFLAFRFVMNRKLVAKASADVQMEDEMEWHA